MKPARLAEIVDTLGGESEPDACWWVDAVTELLAALTEAEAVRRMALDANTGLRRRITELESEYPLLRSERDALLARIAELEDDRNRGEYVGPCMAPDACPCVSCQTRPR